ncbi:MAG: molybdate ABC transporter substrate-binding protein [Rickettsiales bacterium]|nr:molybdate ABC transporter substrate-binding protein [Rickettsiales bacterium]
MFPLLIATLPFTGTAQLTDIELTNITVLADRALAVPLSKLASQYSREHNITITVGYAPSFEQTVEIQEGEAADLFISAHPKSLEHLKQRGLFDVSSLKPLVRANLSLIYTGDKDKLNHRDDVELLLKEPAAFIAIASPAATAEGFYAKQAISYSQKANRSIAEMPDTESMLNLLSKTENAAFAVMFEPDALLNSADHIVHTIPAKWHDEAIFTSAVIPGESMEPAREFQSFLQSEAAQREFIKYRFYPAVTASIEKPKQENG